MLNNDFFARDTCIVAKALLGRIIWVRYKKLWLKSRIIETEAYYLDDKASHASLGYTLKRNALFMAAGTIYMYYARGGDSLNISCFGKGNAVLIKSGFALGSHEEIATMQQLNKINGRIRAKEKLCSGQTLLCRSLALRVTDWDQQQFSADHFYISTSSSYKQPQTIIQTKRLGIREGRDEQLLYRFIDYTFRKYCSCNPLSKRKLKNGQDYLLLSQ